MKVTNSFKHIPNDVDTIQELLDKKIKVFGCFDDSKTIYQIVGTKKEKRPRTSFYPERCTSIYYTATNKVLDSDSKELMLFTGSSQGIKILKRDKKPRAKARSNYVGVELEFISSVSSIILMEKIIKASLANYVTVTYDGSIDVDDEGFQIELKILAREAIIFKVLQKVLKLIPRGSYVNDSCGLHVHLDMRNRDKELAYRTLYDALPYLTERVNYERLENSFCRLNTEASLNSFGKAFLNRNRYQAINPHSYSKHKTLEVRLKESTLNFEEASSWIRDLIDIVNEKKVNRKGVPFVSEPLQVNAS